MAKKVKPVLNGRAVTMPQSMREIMPVRANCAKRIIRIFLDALKKEEFTDISC
jgi:hypothetical protein